MKHFISLLGIVKDNSREWLEKKKSVFKSPLKIAHRPAEHSSMLKWVMVQQQYILLSAQLKAFSSIFTFCLSQCTLSEGIKGTVT